MAQISLGQSDLRKALLRVQRLAVGVRNVYDMLRINLVDMSPMKMFNLFHSGLPALTKLVIGETAKEIHDKLLELLMKYFNTNPPFQFDEALLSGSWSEGLNMHQVHQAKSDTPVMSDMDFMCILKNISFSEEDQACDNLTVKENTPFVNAYITNPVLIKIWEEFLEDPGEDTTKRQLSSMKLKAMLHENYKKMGYFLYGDYEECKIIGDGPSLELKRELPKFDPDDPHQYVPDIITYKIMASSDIILTIRCDGWPRCAWEWVSRDRLWPDKNLVKRICQEGFHIVPKSSLKGNFRLSFSNAETTLIENLTPLQHKVIRAFKAVIKYHQSNWSPNIKDIICTYHLKTIAFWHVEKTTQDSWTEDNVVSHLLSLIEEFAEALRKRDLPMYFLPEYNLLENVENCEEMKKISDKIAELSKDIPAITTAVTAVANTTIGDVMKSVLFRASQKTFGEVMGKFMGKVRWLMGVEICENGFEEVFNRLGKLERGFQKLEREFQVPKEIAYFCAIVDNFFCNKLKKENETFISLD